MDVLRQNDELNEELNIVYRYLLKLGISKLDAEDAVQEAAYKYLLYYDSIKNAKIRGWLIRVALNAYYDQCRKQGRYVLDLNESVLKVDIQELPENIFLQKERNSELGKALSQLKPHFQELLLLKYQSGLTYEEISKLLEISVSSIKTNLFRARKKLEEIYKEATYERQ
ncbi:RNA polymerase sigma factor [Robertmurraya kyonggiensis]|uniref:Sigma-70 family RNA polymerase sigma factor n=1 Tax=Robertmurraya kyonggiensis TaxID=1037680 RepID=A0A4V5P224_9BACI|nr:sigma-70 family RNA polymerase sigma factor [Robertmurraya kyonggiensis]TKC14950.1 sigma-70 family RNA polymerase sigma factor [Robertmurraya kyonggiensis]